MKNVSSLLMALCGSGMLLGCASNAMHSTSTQTSASLQKAIDTAESLYRRGRELHLQHQFNEAEQSYAKALAQDPNHLETRNAIAVLNASRGDLDRAVTLLTALSESQPNAGHVFANLGHAYYLKGQYAQAQLALEHALSLDPENEATQSKLTVVMGAIQQAQAALDQARLSAVAAAAEEGGIEIRAVTPNVYTLTYPVNTVAASSQASIVVVESAQPGKPVPAAPVKPAAAIRVTLVNGNGVSGLARAVRGLIPEQGWRVVSVVNHPSFDLKVTRIEYDDEHLPAARQLAETIAGGAELQRNQRQSGSHVRVLLGHDFKNVNALRERLAGLAVAKVY